MQDSLEMFEKNFYEAFKAEAPMEEATLKSIFKIAKKKSMELFDKTAVGEVKNEFHA